MYGGCDWLCDCTEWYEPLGDTPLPTSIITRWHFMKVSTTYTTTKNFYNYCIAENCLTKYNDLDILSKQYSMGIKMPWFMLWLRNKTFQHLNRLYYRPSLFSLFLISTNPLTAISNQNLTEQCERIIGKFWKKEANSVFILRWSSVNTHYAQLRSNNATRTLTSPPGCRSGSRWHHIIYIDLSSSQWC